MDFPCLKRLISFAQKNDLTECDEKYGQINPTCPQSDRDEGNVHRFTFETNVMIAT
jgi:hypothetical protein